MLIRVPERRAVSYRPSLKTAMAAGACTRICMNGRIVRVNSTVLIRITIDSAARSSAGVDIYLQYVEVNQAWRNLIFIEYTIVKLAEQDWEKWNKLNSQIKNLSFTYW